jgi:hypothetical protein
MPTEQLASLMDYLWAQIIGVVEDSDIDKWTNILFVVILVIFWVGGGLLKILGAKAQKRRQQRQVPAEPRPIKPQPSSAPSTAKPGAAPAPKRLVRPAPKIQPRPQIQRPRPPKKTLVRPQPATLRPTSAKPDVEPAPVELLKELQPEGQQLSAPMPKLAEVKPEIEELPDFTAKTVKKLATETGLTSQIPSTKYMAGILSDYANAESLRRAILHYEILGKPLSLRGPGEQLIGLSFSPN